MVGTLSDYSSFLKRFLARAICREITALPSHSVQKQNSAAEIARLSHVRESAWESNPPAQFVTPPNGFEDRDSHRAMCALNRDCRQSYAGCQLLRQRQRVCRVATACVAPPLVVIVSALTLETTGVSHQQVHRPR